MQIFWHLDEQPVTANFYKINDNSIYLNIACGTDILNLFFHGDEAAKFLSTLLESHANCMLTSAVSA